MLFSSCQWARKGRTSPHGDSGVDLGWLAVAHAVCCAASGAARCSWPCLNCCVVLGAMQLHPECLVCAWSRALDAAMPEMVGAVHDHQLARAGAAGGEAQEVPAGWMF